MPRSSASGAKASVAFDAGAIRRTRLPMRSEPWRSRPGGSPSTSRSPRRCEGPLPSTCNAYLACSDPGRRSAETAAFNAEVRDIYRARGVSDGAKSPARNAADRGPTRALASIVWDRENTGDSWKRTLDSALGAPGSESRNAGVARMGSRPTPACRATRPERTCANPATPARSGFVRDAEAEARCAASRCEGRRFG